MVAMQHLQGKAYECFPIGTLLWQVPWKSFPTMLITYIACAKALLAFSMLSILIGIFSFTFLVMGKGGIMQAENPVDETVFFLKFILEIRLFSPLSASINPSDMTINSGYFGTCNHIPKESTTVILSKPGSIVKKSGSGLHNCSEETMSDQHRLRK